MRKGVHLFAERIFLAAGVTLLLIFAAARIHRFMFSQLALVQFDQAQAALLQKSSKSSVKAPGDEGVDFSLWSEKRVRAYRESLLINKDLPLAVLCLDRLRIRVPVFEGTDDLVLNRGVGWIPGTASPGAAGNSNIGIAGHRDGFFRGFKDIVIGDAVELCTPGVVSLYTVVSVEIVTPDDVGVLQPRGVPSLTLTTCYPFYFVGDAPQRFIVHAALMRQVGVRKLQDTGSASMRTGQFDTKEKKHD